MGARSGATVLAHTCTLSCNRTERGDAANPDLNFETWLRKCPLLSLMLYRTEGITILHPPPGSSLQTTSSVVAGV